MAFSCGKTWMATQLCSVEQQSWKFRQQKYERWLIFNLSGSLIVCTLSDVSSHFSSPTSSCLRLPEARVSNKGLFSGCNKGLHYTKKIKQKERVHNEWEKNEWCSGGGKKTLLWMFPYRAENAADGMSFYSRHRTCVERKGSAVCLPEKKRQTISPAWHSTKGSLVWHLYRVVLLFKGVTY